MEVLVIMGARGWRVLEEEEEEEEEEEDEEEEEEEERNTNIWEPSTSNYTTN